MENWEVRDAWERFVGCGDLPGTVRDAVAASWRRCQDFDVEIFRRHAPLISEGELHRRRADNALLTSAARPAMERASGFLNDADSMLILTDASGLIIETLGDKRTIAFGRDIHLELGGLWSEQKIGTNAIGTAAAIKQPVQIHAAEHFCEDVQRWTCAATPISHPVDNEVLGIMDVSGPARTFSSQSLAFVVAIADQIEARMSQAINRDRTKLLGRFQEKQRKWASHEMIVVDRRGAVVHATVNALRALAHRRGGDAGGADLAFLRSLPFKEWEDSLARWLPNSRMALVSEGGAELGAIIVFPLNVRLRTVRVVDSRARRHGRMETVTLFPPDCVNFEAPRAENASPAESSRDARTGEPSLRRTGPPPAFVAEDARVAQIVEQVASAAKLGMQILICGETGTGKEELARYAHLASGRGGAFVPVNCAALPDSLIEAELFGYVDGAFTGARRGGAPGLAKEADGGTLFLDEIGDMPFALQSALLRFLDDFVIRPIGGTSSKVDVLVVAATNARLEDAIAARKFRVDLFYRLNALMITLPPLAQRGDLDAIVNYHLEKLNPACRITPEAVARLLRYAWPGNVRELRTTLARMVLLANENRIDEKLVSNMLTPHGPPQGGGTLRDSQLARLLTVYSDTGRNVSETARRLGVSRNTVYRALNARGDEEDPA